MAKFKGKGLGNGKSFETLLGGDCLTQIFPFQKYAQNSKAWVSCRYGCDRVLGKTYQSKHSHSLAQRSLKTDRPGSRGDFLGGPARPPAEA